MSIIKAIHYFLRMLLKIVNTTHRLEVSSSRSSSKRPDLML